MAAGAAGAAGAEFVAAFGVGAAVAFVDPVEAGEGAGDEAGVEVVDGLLATVAAGGGGLPLD